VFALGGKSLITLLYTEGSAVPACCDLFHLSAKPAASGVPTPPSLPWSATSSARLPALLSLLAPRLAGLRDAYASLCQNARREQQARRARLAAAADADFDTPVTTPLVAAGEIARAIGPQEVSGRIVELPVADDQFVHKGNLLMVIDPTNYKIAVNLAEAAVQQAQANAQNAEREAKRRLELTDLAVTVERQQTFASSAMVAQAQYQQAVASLDQARVNLRRTEIRSPVNGYVTNPLAQLGTTPMSGRMKSRSSTPTRSGSTAISRRPISARSV